MIKLYLDEEIDLDYVAEVGQYLIDKLGDIGIGASGWEYEQ